jgi:hypothetical protein
MMASFPRVSGFPLLSFGLEFWFYYQLVSFYAYFEVTEKITLLPLLSKFPYWGK